MTEDGQETARAAADEIVARLHALIGEPQVSEAYVRFRLDVLTAQRAARRALTSSRSGPLPAGPLPLGPDDIPLPAEILGALLEAIRVAAATHGRETEDIRRVTEAAAADPGLLPTLAAAAAFGPDIEALESLARRYGIYLDALLFVGRSLAAPCVTEAVAARSVGAGGGASGGEPHRCPTCGSPPSVARLRREDGHRLLTCGLCGNQWEAVRLACPCCGTEERESLGVLRLSDADPRWVETCEACKGYIKTVDERRLPQGETIFPLVEEAATLHLDLLAEREGFIRRVPYVLSG